MPQQKIARYVQSVFDRDPQYNMAFFNDLEDIAAKHLKAAGELADKPATIDNVIGLLFAVLGNSKFLGQASLHQRKQHWLRNIKPGFPEPVKVAAFLADVSTSFTEDTSIAGKVIEKVINTEPKTAWDAFCLFPFIIR